MILSIGLVRAGDDSCNNAQTRSKRKAEQVEQGEDVVGDAAGIDMVHEGVEQGGVRSHVSRDRPMPGSCSNSASSAFFLSSPRASLSACADSLRALARPARPMRSNVSALGNTNRCAFISPLKRARMMRPSSVSNAARAAPSVRTDILVCIYTWARPVRTLHAWPCSERPVRVRRVGRGMTWSGA